MAPTRPAGAPGVAKRARPGGPRAAGRGSSLPGVNLRDTGDTTWQSRSAGRSSGPRGSGGGNPASGSRSGWWSRKGRPREGRRSPGGKRPAGREECYQDVRCFVSGTRAPCLRTHHERSWIADSPRIARRFGSLLVFRFDRRAHSATLLLSERGVGGRGRFPVKPAGGTGRDGRKPTCSSHKGCVARAACRTAARGGRSRGIEPASGGGHPSHTSALAS